MLLFASCGQQYRAQSVAKDFMAQQLNKADADYLDFSDVDSTHSISDSLVDVLRRRGPKGISYLDRKGRILLYIRAKYLDGQDTCSTLSTLILKLRGWWLSKTTEQYRSL